MVRDSLDTGVQVVFAHHLLPVTTFVFGEDGVGGAVVAGTCSAAYAVYVGFNVWGGVIVDDGTRASDLRRRCAGVVGGRADGRDEVDAAGEGVRTDEQVDFTAVELLERGNACTGRKR